MLVKNIVLAGVVLALASCSAPGALHAQVAVGTVLSEDAAGYPHAFIVMDNGDVYRSDFGTHTTAEFPQLPWFLACNIFSGGGSRERIVGIGAGTVLTAGGGTYRLGIGAGQPCYAIYDGVIDHPAGQSFVAIGSNISINGCHIYAVTDVGHVYRAWVGCGGSGWEDAGLLPTGPTPAARVSWGSLKTVYR